MKYFISILFLLQSFVFLSQTISMPAGNTTTTMCSGNFYDSGGITGNYGSSQSRTLTICPGVSGNKVIAQFSTFVVENSYDFLYIYDGPNTTSPSLGVYSGAVAPGLVQATTTNTSGCLTFRFTSDGIVNYAGWAASISCITPCENIIANLVSTSPVAGAGGIIRICQGSSVTFNGSGTFSSGSSIGATYSWNFGDGTSSPASSSASASHAFSTPGIYKVNLNIVKAGCINYNKTDVIVQVSTTPSFSATSISSTSICLGQTAILTGSVTPTPFSINCTPPIAGTTFLPDGSGVSYSTCINVNCYSPGQLVTSASNIQNICLNMEHSFLGDLQIEIICPNGTIVPLKLYSSGGGGTYLGNPLDDPATGPGTGFNYCFAMGAPTTVVSGPTVTAGTPAGSSIAPGTYAPDGNFSSLVGCPLNGSWCIKVTDNVSWDNGYMFGWDINFNVIPSTTASFTPNIVSQVWSGPNIISTSGNNATIQPTATGTYCYTLTAVDNFSCTYNTVKCINVGPGPFAGNDNTLTICANGSTTNLFSLLGTGVSTAGTWSGPSSLTSGNLGAYNPNLASPGSYTYSVPGSGSCPPDIAIVVVIENAIPTLTVPSGTICQGSSFTMNPTGATSYAYSSGTAIVIPATTTNYTVMGSNASGCTNTAVCSVSVNPKPTVTVPSGTICQGGSFTMNPTGATSYTYSSGTAIVIPATTTNYTVMGSNASGCTNTAVCTVSVNPKPTVTVPSGTICQGSSFTMNPTGATSYTYSSGTAIVSPATTTNYTVTGSNASGCTNTAVCTVSVNPNPTVTVPSGTICQGGSFTMNPTGATSYTYSSGTAIVSPATATNYTVTGSNASGCTNTAVCTVSVNPKPTVTVPSGTICQGGSFTMNPTGATSYTYSSGTAIVSPATTTNYTVTGSNASGCTNTTVCTVSVNPKPTVTVPSGTICQGSSFTMNPTGATSYTYSSGTAIVIPATTTNYTVMGSNASGCTNTAVCTVSVNPNPTVTVASGTICQGGSFTMTPTGATSYTYSSGSAVVSPITTSSYTVTGSNALGCTNTSVCTVFVNPNPTVVVNPASICTGGTHTFTPTGAVTYTYSSGSAIVTPTSNTTYTISGTSAVGCLGNAITTVTVSGSLIFTVNSGTICSGNSFTMIPSGASTYTYSSGSSVVTPTSNTTYTVTGASSAGCLGVITSIVSVNPNPTVTVPSGTICQGSSFTMNPTGATSYAYSSGTAIVIPATTTNYTVMGSNASGCTNTAVCSVSVNPKPTVTVPSGTICQGGSFTMNPTGATSYTYSSGTAIVIPATTTNYTVTGSNASGCTNTAVCTVSVNPKPTVTVSSGTICQGSSFTMTPTGATSYTYSSGSAVVSPITTTSYTVIGSNASGCTNTAVCTVSVNPKPTVTVPSGTICQGSSFTMNPTGATSYAYSSGTAIVIPATTTNYTVTGSNASGCTNTAVCTVSVNPNPTVTVPSGTICQGSSFTMNPTGATSYTYSSGSAVVSPATTTNYTVTGSNASGCTNTAVCTVSVNPNPTVTVASGTICQGGSFTMNPTGATSYTYSSGTAIVSPATTTNYTVTGSNASGCTNTTVCTVSVNPKPTVTVPSGTICQGSSFTMNPTGATSYTYSSGTAIVIPATTTNYTVMGSNASGCTNTAVCTVSVNPKPTVTLSSGSICQGGSFTMTPTGATSYTYSSGSAVVSPATTTNYTVTGSNTSGCTNTAVCTVSVNPKPTVTLSSGSICQGGSFTMNPTGATSYTYSSGTAIVSPATTTNYTVTGSNASGCTNTAVCTVSVNPKPTVTVSSGTICQGSSFTMNPTGATSYTYSSGSAVVSPAITTNYIVTGNDALGCTNTAVCTVSVVPTPIVSVNSPTICSGQTATLTASGASTYSWSTGSLLNPILVSPPASTIYNVTGTSLGCSTTTVVTVVVHPLPVMSVNNSTICIGQTTTLTASGANSYLWNTGSMSNPFIISPLVSTSYTVVGTTLGCSQLAISTVVVNPLPILSANSASVCSGQSSILSVNGANTYTWSPGSNLNTTSGAFVSASPSMSTIYNISGTSINGCINTTTVSLFVLATPSLVAVASPSAVCAGNPINLVASGALNYTWTPGSIYTNSLTITPASSSVYSVIGENVSGGLSCATTQTVLVNVIQSIVINTSSTDSICLGESKVIFAAGGITYSWLPTIGVANPNAASTSVKPLVTTEYTVTVSNGGLCPKKGTVKIIVNPLPIVYAGRDTTINSDEAYVLHGSSNAANYGFLNPSGSVLNCNFCSTVEVAPKITTCYILKGENNHQCVAYDEVCINVTNDYGLYIPNAFSPNGDQDNEQFMPVGYGIKSFKLSIFDRWGVEIFKSQDTTIGWDGKYKGKICEQGVYVFNLVVYTIDGKEIIKTGHLTLLGDSN